MTKTITSLGNQIQIDDITNHNVMPGITIEALVDQVCFAIQMVLSQSNNPIELRNSVGTVLAALNSTGYFQAAIGNSNTPGFSFYADPNTGLFSSATDTLNLTVGGYELLKLVLDILTIGRGDGTASPQSLTLRGPSGIGQNISGVNITIDAPNGSGTGGSGGVIFRVAPPLVNSSGTIVSDGTSTASPSTGNVTSLTWSHTIGSGLQRLLVVTISHSQPSIITGVTYGGVALTQLDTSTMGTSGTTEIWYLIGPAIGTANIIVSANTTNLMIAGASSWFEVHQVTPFGTTYKTNGTGTSGSIAVSGAVGDVIIDSLYKANSTESPTSTQTNLYSVATNNATVTANRHNASSKASGAESVTMGYSWGISRNWSILGVALKPGGNSLTNTLASIVEIKNSGVSIGDISGGNYTKIETDGTMMLVGNATGWKDVFFPQSPPKTSGAGNPSLGTILGNLRGYSYTINDVHDFDPQEYPHDGKTGSDIIWHIHWISMTNVAAERRVKWEIEFSWALPNSAMVSTVTQSVECIIPANTAANTHYLTDIYTYTPTNVRPGSMFWVRLKRVSPSTGTSPANDPYVAGIHFHYQVDTPAGSRDIVNK